MGIKTSVRAFIEKELISGAVERNREYASHYVTKENGVSTAWETVLYDPQTSGGLLIAVAKDKSQDLISLLREKGVEQASIIGEIVVESEGKIILKKNS